MIGQTRAQLTTAIERMNVGKSTVFVGASWRETDMFLHTVHEMGGRVDVFRRVVSSEAGGFIRFAALDADPEQYRSARAVIVFDHHAERVMNNRHNPRDARWVHAQTMSRRFE